MAFRKTSIAISRASVTDLTRPIAPPQVGDVNEEGMTWDGRAWVSPKGSPEGNPQILTADLPQEN